MVIKQILYPTDFSGTAQYAGRYASMLAREVGARLHILHVTVPSLAGISRSEMPGLELSRLYKAGRDQAEAHLKELLQSEDFQGLELETTLTSGTIEDEILNAAVKDQTDLIVMGTHGRTGLAHALLGSVAEKVIRTAPCPVFAVRHPELSIETPWGSVLPGKRKAKEAPKLHTILIPLDGSALAEAILPRVKEFAKPFAAHLLLLRVAMAVPPFPIGIDPIDLERMVMDEAGSYLSAKQKELEWEGFSAGIVVQYGNAAEKILEYVESHEVDLIAMTTHGRSGLRRWFLGSVAEKVLRDSDTPVLLFRAWQPRMS